MSEAPESPCANTGRRVTSGGKASRPRTEAREVSPERAHGAATTPQGMPLGPDPGAVRDLERRRLAQELHDGLGQLLSSASIMLDRLVKACAGRAVASDLEKLQALLCRADGELDEAIFLLRPVALEDEGLGQAVLDHVQTWSALTGLRVQAHLRGLLDESASGPVEVAAFRVLQEALANVARHAGARHVTVRLEMFGDTLFGSVQDDGIGFDTLNCANAVARRGGWGLAGMRQRIESLGGTFLVESRHGFGTTLSFRLPA